MPRTPLSPSAVPVYAGKQNGSVGRAVRPLVGFLNPSRQIFYFFGVSPCRRAKGVKSICRAALQVPIACGCVSRAFVAWQFNQLTILFFNL
jgi:hypothetical protein